jgi:transcriptional regulator with XRE-family HTH domain
VSDAAGPEDPGRRLARRLRELREAGFTGRAIPQKQLAGALGVSAPLVSSWERDANPVAPPEVRIEAYARFFATSRSIANGKARLLRQGDLTNEEDTRRQKLEAELLALRASALGEAPVPAGLAGEGPWRFPDGEPVTIVCAELPEELRAGMRYADPTDPDYIRLYTYADLDALIELHGHIRATNPTTQVNIRLASELVADDYSTHLALLGGVDLNPITRHLLEMVTVPVGQGSFYDDPVNAGFEAQTGSGPRRWQATLVEEGGIRTLIEDVAHFFRGPNPLEHHRTVTICNGMFGRGTLGAVRALTDAKFRDRNAAYLRKRFNSEDAYSVLTRVRIVKGQAVTPDWTADDVLHEWPEATE